MEPITEDAKIKWKIEKRTWKKETKGRKEKSVGNLDVSLPSFSAAGFQLVPHLTASVSPVASPWMLHMSSANF